MRSSLRLRVVVVAAALAGSGCDSVVSLLAGKEIDTSICTLSVEVPADSCTCVEGVSWSVVDAEGAVHTNVEDSVGSGLQSAGTTQTTPIAPGPLVLTSTWHYLDGDESVSEGQGECQGGGVAAFHLGCDCDGLDSGTGPDTGARG